LTFGIVIVDRNTLFELIRRDLKQSQKQPRAMALHSHTSFSKKVKQEFPRTNGFLGKTDQLLLFRIFLAQVIFLLQIGNQKIETDTPIEFCGEMILKVS
jgi:hypothetical protein